MPRRKSIPHRMVMFGNKFSTPSRAALGSAIIAGQKFHTSFVRGSRSASDMRHGGTNTSHIYQRPKKRRSTRSFKAKLMNVQPSKHYSYTADQACTHSTIYTTCPTSGIVQGTTNATRDGDLVNLAALKGKFHYASPAASGAYVGRFIIGYSGEEYTGLGSDFGAGITTTELFLPSTFGVTINGIINPKAFTVLYDETIDLNSQLAGARDVSSGAFTLQLDTSFPYQSSGSTMGKSRNLYVLFMAAVMDGVSGTTASGDISVALDLIFKD